MKNFSENIKYAGVLITGKQMTSSQTLDVIMKLDLALRSGFNICFDSKVNSVTKRLSTETNLHKLFDVLAYEYNQSLMFCEELFHVNILKNSRTCCVDSWFLKDGTIFYHANIGEYPNTDDIVSYWKNVAKIFPFLELNITVLDCELSSILYVNKDEVFLDEGAFYLFNDYSYFDELKQFALFNLNVSAGMVAVEDVDLDVHWKNMPTLEQLIELSATPNLHYEDCYVNDEQVEYIVQQTKKQVDEFLDKQKTQSKLIKVLVEYHEDAKMACTDSGVEVVGYSCAISSQSLLKELINFSRYRFDSTNLKLLHDFVLKFNMDLEENKNHPVHKFLKTETLKDLFTKNKKYKLDLTDRLSVIFELFEL